MSSNARGGCCPICCSCHLSWRFVADPGRCEDAPSGIEVPFGLLADPLGDARRQLVDLGGAAGLVGAASDQAAIRPQ
jgi:hypothetical protein